MAPLPSDKCLCNELPSATAANDNFNFSIDSDDKVLSGQCCAVQNVNMAPNKKMRHSVKTMPADKGRKKTVHFGDEDVVEEETDDFPSVDFFIFNDNTEEHQVQLCDSDTDTEEGEEEPSEATNTTSDDLQQLYSAYRLEVEQLIRSSAAMGNEKRILTLERLVDDLLEQNQTLVTSLAEIKEESARRVAAMHHRLQASAARTEEVMLSLASHELLLKKFVQEHCCTCCSCDLRLMQFRLCHQERCDDEHLQPLEDGESFQALSLGQCRTVYQQGHRQWNSILHNTSAWFDRRRLTTRKRLLPADDTCAHNLPSQLRFTSFVNQIDDRLEALEAENEEVKHENALLRELNSLLSGRNGPPMTITSYAHQRENNQLPSMYRVEAGGGGGGSVGGSSAASTASTASSYTNGINCTKEEKLPLHHHHHHQPNHQHHQHHLPTLLHDDNESEADETTTALSEHLITFLGECSQRNRTADDFGNYLHDSLDLRDGLFGSLSSEHGGSRSESLNSHGRTDNDSGCSTDLIPSQTDMNSLMTSHSSDGEEEVEELLRSVIAESAANRGKKLSKELGGSNTTDHQQTVHSNSGSNNCNSSTAERLVPKLYSKLLYYLVQRNMLLRQFQQENRARQKCKEELSTLADCVAAGLKDIELNTKVIKQIQLQSDTSLF